MEQTYSIARVSNPEFNHEDARLLQRKLQQAINTKAEIITTSDGQRIKITASGSDLENILGSIKTVLESSEVPFEADKSNNFILLSESQYQKLLQNYLSVSNNNQENESLDLSGDRSKSEPGDKGKKVTDKSMDEKQWDPSSIHYKADQGKNGNEDSVANTKKANNFHRDLPHRGQDREVTKNAFNQQNNPNYYYQATDITLIQRQVLQAYATDFVIHEPIGNNQSVQPILRGLVESLDIVKPTICIYNLGNYHWVTFAAIKEGTNTIVLYKDSLGCPNSSFEKQIKDIDKTAQVIAHRMREQTSDVDCGIFAIENMRTMAMELLKDKEGFVSKFTTFDGFCTLSKAKELRKNTFSKEFVLGKEQEMHEELVKAAKLIQLRSQHQSEIETIIKILREQNHEFFEKYHIKSFDNKLENETNTIYVDIATSSRTDLTDSNSNYVYHYRISLSKDLKANSKEIAENIKKVLGVIAEENAELADFNEELAMLINEDKINIAHKNPKKAIIEEGNLPKIKIDDLIDNLSLGSNLSLKEEVQLIISLRNALPNEFTTNIRNIIQDYNGLNLAILASELAVPIIEELVSTESAEKKASRIKEIKKSLKSGQEYYNQRNFKDAEKELVKVIKSVFSKPNPKLDTKSLYVKVEDIKVKVEDVKEEVLAAMYHLGLIYLNDSSYFNHHAKAAAIFQYCAVFSEKQKVVFTLEGNVLGNAEYFIKQAYLVEQGFLQSIGKGSIAENDREPSSQQKISKYKQQLYETRSKIKAKLDEIENFTIERIADRAKAVEEIYKTCSNFFVSHNTAQISQAVQENEQEHGLVQRLLEDCHQQLGYPPEGCEYAIIALGSLAGGKMTPYSDLEFAILINEDRQEYKEYFQNLTKLLHIKVINFGETMLRGVGIESLNNFKTGEKEDEWFWDSTIMKSGFSFDGAHEHACKSPLGRFGGYRLKDKFGGYQNLRDFELILTPQQMAEFQKEEDWFKPDKHLVQALKTVSLITGRQSLLDGYRQQIKDTGNPEYQKVLKARALEILLEDVDKFLLKIGNEEEGKLYDIKRDIYRLGDRIIDALANYYVVDSEEGQRGLTTWEVIRTMEYRGILSKDGAQHLQEALSIATELRLKTYCHNNGQQKEAMSTKELIAEHLDEEQRKNLIEETFYLPDITIVHHFYYVMLQVQGVVKASCNNDRHILIESALKSDRLFYDGNFIKGMVHARLLQYDKALSYIEQASIEEFQNFQNLRAVLGNLFQLYIKTGKGELAVRFGETLKNLLQPKDIDRVDIAQQVDIAHNYDNLGCAYKINQTYEKAIAYHQKALDIYNRLLSELSTKEQGLEACGVSERNAPSVREDLSSGATTQMPLEVEPQKKLITISKAKCFDNMGSAYCEQNNYDMALQYHKQALEIFEKHDDYKESKESALSHYFQGAVYNSIGNYDMALYHHKQALDIRLKIYEYTSNHHSIAQSYNSLGSIYKAKGKFNEAIKCFKISLDIKLVIYSSIPSHSDIAHTCVNLGNLNSIMDKHDQALKYYTQALEIFKKVYTYNPKDIVNYHNNIGNLYNEVGEYQKAIVHSNAGLKCARIIHGNNYNHPEIAYSCNNLGISYYRLGNLDAALKYHSDALHIRYKVYEKFPNNRDIAYSHVNLGNVYRAKNDYQLAFCHQKKALKIRKKLYKDNLNHPELADSYNNLGNVLNNLGESEEAIKGHEKALKIRKVVYKNMPNHQKIANSYDNLGNAYQEKGDNIEAIGFHKLALNIYLECFKGNLNNHKLALCYNNLSTAYYRNGDFEEAHEYALKALSIYLANHHPNITKSNALIKVSTVQIGNLLLLKENIEEAQRYYCLGSKSKQIDLSSPEFIKLILESINFAHFYNALNSSINNQLVLLKVDPDLKYGNHYHNLACAYACRGNIKEANETFIKAFTYPNIGGGLHAEYAQFLIINKNLSDFTVNTQEVSNHLYAAINSNNVNRLLYTKIDQTNGKICSILSKFIKEKNSPIVINSKILTYYLLIKNPEYLKADDKVEFLTESFKNYCSKLQDELSFRLLSNVYHSLNNKDLAVQYFDKAKLIVQIDNILSGKTVFSKKLEQYKNIDFKKIKQYMYLKQIGAELDQSLIQLVEKDIATIMQIERQAIVQVQLQIQQQTIGAIEKGESEDPDTNVNIHIVGDIKDDTHNDG
jgi:tetratricopeptide (TPR) repeat protein